MNFYLEKSYQYHRNLLKGPSISTIYRWINQLSLPKFDSFRNIQNLPSIINFWKDLYNFDTILCSLSVDAMKIDEDLVINHNGNVYGTLNKVRIKIPS